MNNLQPQHVSLGFYTQQKIKMIKISAFKFKGFEPVRRIMYDENSFWKI